jgi:hypothetical protein
MSTSVFFVSAYLSIGCIFAALAKKMDPYSFWAFVGPLFILLWPALLPVALLVSISGWIYGKL